MAAVAGGAPSIGFEVCWLRLVTGLPCPGCGLTRSISALARGDLVLAAHYHPFGLLVLAYALIAASSLLWPESWRQWARRRLELRWRRVHRLYGVIVSGFVVFGVLRAFGVGIGWWPDLP